MAKIRRQNANCFVARHEIFIKQLKISMYKKTIMILYLFALKNLTQVFWPKLKLFITKTRYPTKTYVKINTQNAKEVEGKIRNSPLLKGQLLKDESLPIC